MSKNIALVGYGYWGPNLLRNLFANQDCEVAYCCDTDEKKLSGVHKVFPGITLTTDFGVVLADPTVDAVVLTTPTATHFPLGEKAILAGKDVLFEKPMTLTSREAYTLVELAKRHKRVLMVDHTFLFNDAVTKIKELLESGEIGDILYIDSVRVNLGLFQKDTNVIFDLASHDFAIINYLLQSKPLSVQAHASTHFGSYENVAYVFSEYPKGITTHVHVSWLSPAKIRQMLIVGTKKMIAYDDIEPTEKIRIYDKGVIMDRSSRDVEQMKIGYRSGDVRLPKIDITEPISLLVREFVNVINSRQVLKSSGEFGAGVVDILEKATQSAKSGKKVFFKNAGR